MTKSNPYFKCAKCRQEDIERTKECPITHDIMILCHCADEEEQLIIDKEKNYVTTQESIDNLKSLQN